MDLDGSSAVLPICLREEPGPPKLPLENQTAILIIRATSDHIKNHFKVALIAAALYAVAVSLSLRRHLILELFPDGFDIGIDGKLDVGDGEKFVAYYTNLAAKTGKSLIWITLDSPGGSIKDALKIASIVETTGATTRVRGGTCASACFLYGQPESGAWLTEIAGSVSIRQLTSCARGPWRCDQRNAT